MPTPSRRLRRIAATAVAGCAAFVFAASAGAVDLRDWGRKYNAATERFVVLAQFNNEAVLDKETQLVWERAPLAGLQQWFNSAYAICGVKSVGGRRGWRLPSLFELMTLIDTSVPGGVKLPQGHPFAGIQANDDFWTATDALSNSSANSVGVDIGSAVLTSYPKTSYVARAWCVRAPGSPGGY